MVRQTADNLINQLILIGYLMSTDQLLKAIYQCQEKEVMDPLYRFLTYGLQTLTQWVTATLMNVPCQAKLLG